MCIWMRRSKARICIKNLQVPSHPLRYPSRTHKKVTFSNFAQKINNLPQTFSSMKFATTSWVRRWFAHFVWKFTHEIFLWVCLWCIGSVCRSCYSSNANYVCICLCMYGSYFAQVHCSVDINVKSLIPFHLSSSCCVLVTICLSLSLCHSLRMCSIHENRQQYRCAVLCINGWKNGALNTS